MTINVSVDDRLTCHAVHWDVPAGQARTQFENWGFHDIQDLVVTDRPINGNTARTQVQAMAKRNPGHKWYFKGNYDWGVTADSAIFTFTYSAFTGDLINGSEDVWGNFAGWSGHE